VGAGAGLEVLAAAALGVLIDVSGERGWGCPEGEGEGADRGHRNHRLVVDEGFTGRSRAAVISQPVSYGLLTPVSGGPRCGLRTGTMGG